LLPPENVLILTGKHLVEPTRAILPEIPPENVLAEPKAASTAPALAWATMVAQSRDPEAEIISLHADWFVSDPVLFRENASTAMDVARDHDLLVTVGIVPTRPDIGFGYIEPGDALDDRCQKVKRFTEKPNQEKAVDLIASGAMWNSGMFAWTAKRFFEETRLHAPEIQQSLAFLENNDVDGFFDAVTPVAIDISHFERSERVAVVPGRFPWDDVGTWAALSRVRHTDVSNNVLVGTAFQKDSSGCVVWSDQGAVVLDGVEDLVVVRTGDVTLVTTSARAAQLKELLDVLPPDIKGS
jgi:mannose-1-phosphate guanylyltransferase